MFFGALPPHIGSLCVLPRPFAGGPFLRDFVPHRQTSSSASNIPSRIKLRSLQSDHHSLLTRRRKASHFESAIPAKESTIPAIKPQRILPTAFHHRVIARHSSPQLGSRPCHRLRCSGTFRAHSSSWGPCAQGLSLRGSRALFNCS